jgi:LysR family cys regulon transcriptional activator
MKLQQLRYLCEVARRHFNVSAAAERLSTAQSGISTQIRLLEEELGIPIFERHGKRLLRSTTEGLRIIEMAERVLAESDNIRRYADELRDPGRGTLSIGATHTQAHRLLPEVIKKFSGPYPGVRVRIHQADPIQLLAMLERRDVDIAITSIPEEMPDSVLAMPFQQWNLSVITLPDHPLRGQTLTLETLAAYPLVTYDQMLPVRTLINRAFDQKGLATHIALSDMDSATIITYVKLGLGVGVVSEAALPEQADADYVVTSAKQLFQPVTNNICLHRQRHYPEFVFRLIHLIAPDVDREHIAVLLGKE